MFDKRVFKLDGAGRTMVLLALCSAAGAVLTALQAWALCSVLVSIWSGAGLGSPGDGASALGLFGGGYLLIFALCFVVRRFAEVARERILGRFAAARAGALRERALRRLVEDGGRPAATGGAGTAAGLDVVIEGAERVERFLELSLGKAVEMVVTPLILLAALFPLDWVSGAIALVGYPVIIVFMVLIGSSAHAVASERRDEQDRLSNHFLDALRGIDTLRMFGRARGHAEAIWQVSERLRGATMRTLRVATLSSAVLDLCATFALAAVSVMLGFRLVDGQMQLFPALMALVLVPDFFRPIRQFGADYHATLDGKQAFSRMLEIADAPARPVAELAGGTWGEGSVLEVHGVSVAYDVTDDSGVSVSGGAVEDAASASATGSAAASSHPVLGGSSHLALRDISLTLRGCERVAVVGASGSGKSTFMGVLAGFVDPAAGAFEFAWGDGAETGVMQAGAGSQPASMAGSHPAPSASLASLNASSWQHQVLYIPQDPYIFHATLAENIAFYAPEAPRGEIEQAAEAMGLGPLLAALPTGLDTVIGDGAGARRLSGGEAQRVALARAMVDRSRRVLLFDEPTAHLDLETELELKQRMLPLMEGRLVVFATHRLHWLYDMDRAIVLAHGRVAAEGDPRELMASGDVALALEASVDLGEGTHDDQR